MTSKKTHLLIFVIFYFVGKVSVNAALFPDNFKFGIATAAYQVEGAWNEDGKSEGLWDYYTHNYPDYIANQDNGDVACDSYHKWETDLALLKELGVDHYRFSISWPRIIPNGLDNDKINLRGVNYYKKIVRDLKANGIEPMITLYHWDLPSYLHQLGGWTNPKIADYFAHYARTVFTLFNDVNYWITFNEPRSFCVDGYRAYNQAPFYTNGGWATYKCAYTVLKAHAAAYHIYHDELGLNGKIAIVLNSDWGEPLTDSTEDVDAANRYLEFTTGLYANPIYNGDWPQVVIDQVSRVSGLQGFEISRLPAFTQEEIDYINGTYDYYAMNYYTGHLINSTEFSEDDEITFENDIGAILSNDPAWTIASATWLAWVPEGFRKMLNWIKNRYGDIEIIITENGVSDVNGTLNDTHRVEFYEQYLENVLAAIREDNVNVTAYTAWSLMDNFEWHDGYTQKFGLYHVDFTTANRTRTIKSSGQFYKSLVESHCVRAPCPSSATSISFTVAAVLTFIMTFVNHFCS